jgi:hypothetical protein
VIPTVYSFGKAKISGTASAQGWAGWKRRCSAVKAAVEAVTSKERNEKE